MTWAEEHVTKTTPTPLSNLGTQEQRLSSVYLPHLWPLTPSPRPPTRSPTPRPRPLTATRDEDLSLENADTQMVAMPTDRNHCFQIRSEEFVGNFYARDPQGEAGSSGAVAVTVVMVVMGH